MSTTITDLRLLPSVEITETFLGARAKCLDCGDVEELRDIDEARAWRTDHEGCQAVVDEAHGEALIEEARRLELNLISRSGTIHVEDKDRPGHYLCSTAALTRLPSTAGRTSARPDCAACARKVEQAMARAFEERRDVERDAVARWAADGINIEKTMARLLDSSSGADPAPSVQVPPVPAEVRAGGWAAMVEAAEETVDLAQIYARTLEAVLLPLWSAWIGDKHLMVVPEPDDADESGARWGQLVDATMYGSTPVVRLVGRAWTADDAELRAAELVAAARWGRDRADAVPLDVALAPYAARIDARRDARRAEVEQPGGAS